MSDLFNLYSESITRELESLPWFITSGHNLNIMRHVDDTLLAEQKWKHLDNALKKRKKKRLSIVWSQNVESSAGGTDQDVIYE